MHITIFVYILGMGAAIFVYFWNILDHCRRHLNFWSKKSRELAENCVWGFSRTPVYLPMGGRVAGILRFLGPIFLNLGCARSRRYLAQPNFLSKKTLKRTEEEDHWSFSDEVLGVKKM